MNTSTPRPLLLDTDIGTDIDDVYALLFAAASPEFDLRAVTVVNNDVVLRARLARHLLDWLNRPDVPVGVGQGPSLTPGVTRGWMGHEGRGVDLPPYESGGIESDGVRLIIEHARAARSQGCALTVCLIGAMTNLAVALQRAPDLRDAIGEVVAMAADFGGFGAENRRREHNIACDPVAADIVLRSGLPVTLVGLNVTRETRMTRADVDELEAQGSPLASDVAALHRVWFETIGRDYSPMHDALALAGLVDTAVLQFAGAVAEIATEGPEQGDTTYFEPTGVQPAARVATVIDAERFHALFHARIRRAIEQAI